MKRAAIVIGILCLASAAPAALPDITGIPAQVVFVGPVMPISAAPGKPMKAYLAFRVGATYHINSNKPTSNLLIPTVLTLSPPSQVIITQLKYPSGIDASFPFAPTETLNVYAGKFEITAQIAAAPKAAPGKYQVHGVLKYQACDNRACYPPRQVPADFEVTVKAPSAMPYIR